MHTVLTGVCFLACTASFAVYARTEYGCPAFHSTGTSFQDDNITVIENIQNNTACCDVARAYNEKASTMGMPTGKISVWWRDASLCLIKVDGKKPVARRLTASNVLPKPKPTFRFSSIYTDHMVLQAAPYKARVWGFTVADDNVSVVLDDGAPIAAQIKYMGARDPFAPVMWSAVLPETQASTSVTHTVTVTSTKTGQKSKITDVLFGVFNPLAYLYISGMFCSNIALHYNVIASLLITLIAKLLSFSFLFPGDVWVCSGQSNMVCVAVSPCLHAKPSSSTKNVNNVRPTLSLEAMAEQLYILPSTIPRQK